MTVHFGTVNVDSLEVFYRSADDPTAPVVLLLLLLLHGGDAPAKYQKRYGTALGSAGSAAPSPDTSE